MPNAAAPNPAAFRQSVNSGLYLPPEESRQRQVWTKDEWRLLNRATKMLAEKGVLVQLVCSDPKCKEARLEGARMPDGSFRLRCPHADRLMMRDTGKSEPEKTPGFDRARFRHVKMPTRKHRR